MTTENISLLLEDLKLKSEFVKDALKSSTGVARIRTLNYHILQSEEMDASSLDNFTKRWASSYDAKLKMKAVGDLNKIEKPRDGNIYSVKKKWPTGSISFQGDQVNDVVELKFRFNGFTNQFDFIEYN
ncbi:hypothetical protein ACFFVB_18445 [Formosa undariae]|uniref:Uncharacterized protein n=1 Tax=Formosa undariae TaxID=1325436 RepID=A0ABV5F6I9_9FLAO